MISSMRKAYEELHWANKTTRYMMGLQGPETPLHNNKQNGFISLICVTELISNMDSGCLLCEVGKVKHMAGPPEPYRQPRPWPGHFSHKLAFDLRPAHVFPIHIYPPKHLH